MKTRQIQTRYWDDEFISDAAWQSRYVFLYLLTNPAINLIGLFQLSDKKISLETGLLVEDINIAKEELELEKKALFYRGWVYIPAAFKNNPYWKSSKVWKAWEIEFAKIKPSVLEYFNTTMDTDIHSEQKTLISNNEPASTSQNTQSPMSKEDFLRMRERLVQERSSDIR